MLDRKTSARRMGPPGSAIWHSMLDGAEEILREEGYGALTSRRVADCIGVKQRLVYYYFRTMDELIVETFRRLAGRELERLAKALKSQHPLRDIWEVCVQTADTRLISEFMALANRVGALREEVKKHILECRRMQVTALRKAMRSSEVEDSLPAVAAAIFATSAALSLHRESELGIKMGHAEVSAVIERLIGTWDRKA